MPCEAALESCVVAVVSKIASRSSSLGLRGPPSTGVRGTGGLCSQSSRGFTNCNGES